MLSDDPPVLADYDAICISMNLDRTSDRTGRHRVLVVVEPHQACLRDRRLHRVESIELASIGNELRPLRLEHFPDRLLGQLWMAMHLGVGFLNRRRGVKKRSRTSPTWFSTCPFSQPDAGVQAT